MTIAISCTQLVHMQIVYACLLPILKNRAKGQLIAHSSKYQSRSMGSGKTATTTLCGTQTEYTKPLINAVIVVRVLRLRDTIAITAVQEWMVNHELYLAILYYQLSAVGHYYSAVDVSVEREVNMNEPYCKFRFGVECSSNACEKCGWNPIVEADRIEKMKKGREPYLKIDLSKVRGRE